MLAQMGWLTLRAASEIFALVRADFGTVDERRLWNTLRWLRENGWVEQPERGGGYRRARSKRHVSLVVPRDVRSEA